MYHEGDPKGTSTVGLEAGLVHVAVGLARKAAGKTVFFSSHELSEVELVCDRVGIVANGRLVAEGATAELDSGEWKPNRLRIFSPENKLIAIAEAIAEHEAEKERLAEEARKNRRPAIPPPTTGDPDQDIIAQMAATPSDRTGREAIRILSSPVPKSRVLNPQWGYFISPARTAMARTFSRNGIGQL